MCNVKNGAGDLVGFLSVGCDYLIYLREKSFVFGSSGLRGEAPQIPRELGSRKGPSSFSTRGS